MAAFFAPAPGKGKSRFDGTMRIKGMGDKMLADLLNTPFDIDKFACFSNALARSSIVEPENATVNKAFPDKISPGKILKKYNDYISDCSLIKVFTLKCGNFRNSGCDNDNRKVAVIAVKLRSRPPGENNGSIERSFTARYLDCHKCDAAIAAYYIENEPGWRLSFVKLSNPAGNGKKIVLAKRASWIVGSGSVSLAGNRFRDNMILKYLKKARIDGTLKSMEKAFSLSILTKHFLKACAGDFEMAGQFSFKSDENEPQDQVLAVNPEMIGALMESRLDSRDRKKRGIFYTPSEVVRFMCRESLSQYLSNKTGLPFEDIWEFLQHGDIMKDEDCRLINERDRDEDHQGLRLPESVYKNIDKIDESLVSVRIFDPAVGAGAFPVGMASEIVKVRMNITEYLIAGLKNADCGSALLLRKTRHPGKLKEDAVNCIFGIDIDDRAVEITRLRLKFFLLPRANMPAGSLRSMQDIDLPGSKEIERHILCMDSLMNGEDGSMALKIGQGVFDGKGVFDIVIGNPPYISAVESAKSGKDLRQSLKKKYPQLKGAFDIYAAFLLEGIRRTGNYGVYCWIVPNKLLVSQYAKPVLDCMKQNGLRYAISLSDVDLFSRIGIYPVIVVGNKKTGGKGPAAYTEYRAGSMADLQGRNFRTASVPRPYKTFADFNIKIASGAAGFQARDLAGCITERESAGTMPFIVSGSIDKYAIKYRKVRYMGNTYEKAFVENNGKIAESKWNLWGREKIAIAGLARDIEAVYCKEPLAMGVGTYAIYDFGGFSPFYLLGILNSRFMTWYMNARYRERHLAGGYLSISKTTFQQLPLIGADAETQRLIAQKAETLQNLCSQGDYGDCNLPGSEKIMSEIDKLVYGLFGLGETEIEEIERWYRTEFNKTGREKTAALSAGKNGVNRRSR